MLISPNELAKKIIERKQSATFITLWCQTEPKWLKKSRESGEPNPYIGDVVHQYGRCVVFGGDYTLAVLKRWAEVGVIDEEFSADPLWRGKGIFLNPFMRRHVERGTVYLAYTLQTYPVHKPDGTAHPKAGQCRPALYDEYVNDHNGTIYDVDDLAEFLPKLYDSKKQKQVGANLEGKTTKARETYPRTVKLENVVAITIDGERFDIKPNITIDIDSYVATLVE